MAAFANACVLTAEATAALLGLSPKTLTALTNDGAIRAVPRGKTRGYIEVDIRAYLTESAAPCRSTSRKRAPTGPTTSRSVVVGFMDRRALKRKERPSA
ncbi:MAG: helix-turn-helix domain-containing protein [Brevundimonas sp.]|uniref:helix-turn-helix domain-containing protein n=1 Tax=Brevundimonas sp. TaxID=1871086 RepID=UPI004033EAAA